MLLKPEFIKMLIFHLLTLMLFKTIEGNNANLSISEQTCLINLAQNLKVKNMFILYESKERDFKMIPFLKNIWRNKIFAQFLHIQKFQTSTEFKEKTLFILPSNITLDYLPIIFNTGTENEIFLSNTKWVIWLNKIAKTDELFQNLYIPYDCQFIGIETDNNGNFIFFEFYSTRLESDEIMVSNFAKLDLKNNFQATETDFYQRRFNMNGTMLLMLNTYHVSIEIWFKI